LAQKSAVTKSAQILAPGGMGEVYLAQDTKLDRKVALKILRSKLK
jgi:serine/threonine protein kinase